VAACGLAHSTAAYDGGFGVYGLNMKLPGDEVSGLTEVTTDTRL